MSGASLIAETQRVAHAPRYFDWTDFGIGGLIGFLRLARELLIGDFFHAPSMPGETANQPEETRPETSPHSTTPIA